MNTLKQRIFTNWHLMRIIRLGLSVWLLVMAIQSKDAAVGALALFFLITAITGVGCCGPQGCSVPNRSYSRNETDKTIDRQP
jgi:hypothetical protein